MTQGGRVRQVREYYGLTTEKFGEKLGVQRSAISKIEHERCSLTDANIKAICREFGINEVWLRTGEGGDEGMLSQLPDNDRFSLSLGKLSVSDNKFVQNALITLAETEPEKLKVVEEFMKGCLGLD